MDSRLWIVPSALFSGGILAAFLSVWVIGSESSTLVTISAESAFISIVSAVVSVVSLCIAVGEMRLARQSLVIAQNMQETDKKHKEERRRIIGIYEVPHVKSSLKRLVVNMRRTEQLMLTYGTDGRIKSEDKCKEIRRRVRTHIMAIWHIESKFPYVGLPEYYEHLGVVVAHLEELEATTPDTKIDIERFRHDAKAVLVLVNDMDERRVQN